MEKAFINKKPYVTKKGGSRPGRVTVLSDDRDSAKRVRALYDWVERDKPQAQEPKRRPFEDDGIINKDALKDPKTLQAVADIFDKADRRTVVVSEEGDVRVEHDVSKKDGKPIPGTTRVLDKGRVMITDFAIDPKLGLDGSLSRTKKWIEGLKGGPKDTLAIYVNPETKAVRFTGRGADRVSQGNGIDLEEVVPRMNREGIPVIVMIGNRANVAWPDARPSEREAPVSAPEAKTQEASTSTPPVAPEHVQPSTSSKPQSAPKETSKPSATKAEQEALGELESLMGDLGMLRESGRRSPWRSSSQAGMLREPERNDEAKTLTPEQLTAVQNAMNKVVAASVETAGVRSFDAIAQRLFGLVGRQKPALWKAMRPYLRGAWVTYGDTHEVLDLDEPSRADAKAVFERVERGEAAQPQVVDEPAPQQAPVDEPPAAPEQQQPAQAPQVAPQQAPTDWASAKNGEIRLGEDGKAYIRWEDYWLTPTTGKVRKWVGSRKRGRMETVEVEGVNVHDRLPDGKPGTQAKVFFEPDGRWVNPNNGKVHYGHMQALVDDPKNGYRWTALDRWADDGNPRADMANAREAMERGTLGAVTEPQQKEDEHERTGIQSASGQVGGAVGGQEPSRDGGDGVGGVGAGVPGRGVPVPGGVDVSSGLAGEQPAEGVSDDAAGVGGRVGERGEDGGAVSGATLPVQPEGGDRGVRAGGDAEQSAGGDGGRGQGAAQGVQPPAQEPNPLTDDRAATANYVIPEAGNGGLDAITNARERIAANLAALRVLKALQKEGRQATVAEQRTLSLYTGWGSLGEQLFNDQTPDWSEERAELKGLLTEAEYASARRTVLYSLTLCEKIIKGFENGGDRGRGGGR